MVKIWSLKTDIDSIYEKIRRKICNYEIVRRIFAFKSPHHQIHKSTNPQINTSP